MIRWRTNRILFNWRRLALFCNLSTMVSKLYFKQSPSGSIETSQPARPGTKTYFNQMGRPTEYRCAVISMGMVEQLEPYLGFRHISRHSYTFRLNWSKMRTLVGDLTIVRTAFYAEIKSILDSQ